MFKAVLFDLDGTLLPLDVEIFLKNYTEALAAKAASVTDPKAFVKHLFYATQKVIEDKNPDFTNEEVFWKHFFQNMNEQKDRIFPVIDEFYTKDFPLLGAEIDADKKGAFLVKQLKQQGCRLVLATNAVFPRQAVVERMRWAHLDPEDFEIITTFENMHFCKPHIEYYQEILERLGETPDKCIMVGNDVEEDMIAGSLGMTTFLLDNFVIHRGSDTTYDYKGNMELLWQVLGMESR